MKLGYQPHTAGPLATAARLREYAVRAEELGYDALSVTDHVVLPVNMISRYPYNSSGEVPVDLRADWFDPLAVLGMWSGLTSSIMLQLSVMVLPYRNPVITAKLLASLDALSGGRLEVGVGAGWMREEFEILQAPPFESRGAVTDEYIAVHRTLWEDDFPTFEGDHYRLEGLVMYPKPVRKPRLPLLVGGTTRPALRRAARLGDGWQALRITPESFAAGVERIRSDAEAAERDLPADFEFGLRFGVRISDRPGPLRTGEDADRVAVGTPTQVADQLRAFVDRGCTAIMIDTRTCSIEETEETFVRFIEEVKPLL